MATPVKGKVKAEGRIISLNDKFGFLGAQGIKSKVFLLPSSLKVDPPFPKLCDVLEVDDIVYFEAVEQPERNGAKYVAVDGSVKVKQRGKDVMHEGEGKIVQLDKNRGYFGFIEADIGNVFFNISAVRPSTNDVTKVLKVGQKVKFRCLPNSEQPNCKWRASLVVHPSKASEFFRHPQIHYPQPLSISKSTTSAAASPYDDTSSNRPKSTSFSDYGSSPASPLMFNNVNGGQNTTTTTNGHVRSISPSGTANGSYQDDNTTTTNHRYNIKNGLDAWTVRRSPQTRSATVTSSESMTNTDNDFQLTTSPATTTTPMNNASTDNGKCINASAMWDTFLQQQQALLHPWYAEGRENFYITNNTAAPVINGHNSNDGGSSTRNSGSFSNDSGMNEYDGMNGHFTTNTTTARRSNSSIESCLSPSLDDCVDNTDGNDRMEYESICRQMIKLAHELNGWQDDGCPFCCNNKLY